MLAILLLAVISVVVVYNSKHEKIVSQPAALHVLPSAKPVVKEAPPNPPLIVDSRMTRAQALGKNKFPHHILDKMELVAVEYVGFDGLSRRGQIVVDKELAAEVRQIFLELKAIHYPIKQVVPVVRFQWDDAKSMRANNTSGFNYRGQVTPNGISKVLSKHAQGRAIDLNPWLNPYVSRNGKATSPYRPGEKGVLTRSSAATKIFLKRGWKWGGNWDGSKDYQHFEKP